jgi:hypothetical protein
MVIAVLQTIPSGHRAVPRRMYAIHPHGAVWLVILIPQFSWDCCELQEITKGKNGEGINWTQISSRG